MNSTSLAILQTVLAKDPSLSPGERGAVQRVMDGQIEASANDLLAEFCGSREFPPT